jgi:hypothetical protein
MIRDLINEFGWCFSLFVSCLIGFAVLFWTLEILTFLQKIW